MTIAEVETAIIGKLRSGIEDVAVEPFPDKPSEYALIHPKGALLVSFSGSTFSDPKPTEVIVQDRRMEFDVTVATKNLRTHTGAYALLEAARVTLTGYQIPGASKIYPRREGFISEKSGTWQYGIRFALTTPAMEMDEDEQLVLLKQITAVSAYGDTEVIK